MGMYIGLLISFCLLIYGAFKNIPIAYMIVICWCIFAVVCLRKGFKIKEILGVSYEGAKRSFVVLRLLVLIGALMASWLSCGTISAIVYYCSKLIMPETFILSTFLICAITSFLMGSALGTSTIVGIPMMIIARSGNVDLNMMAGAVVAGAYFGDRCSAVSSSAALVAALTSTNLFTNIKNMLTTAIVPFLLAVAAYGALSFYHPLLAMNSALANELLTEFHIQPVMLAPAAIIALLSLLKIPIHISIPVSILSAVLVSFFFQKYQADQIVYQLIYGFRMADGDLLRNIIKGGGILSMIKTCLLVFVSCALARIFDEIRIFDGIKKVLLRKQLQRHNLFGFTAVISIITAAFGCNQPISCVMTSEIMREGYRKIDNSMFALDLENSSVILSALIPWCVTPLVVTSTMDIGMTGYVPFGFYLYFLPITYFIYLKFFKDKAKIKLSA
ncbi:MAG: Na+/H+ antiporter NhaC family protein [Clostridiaceae bacterium]